MQDRTFGLIEDVEALAVHREMHRVAGLSLQIALNAHQERISALPNVEVSLCAQPLYNRYRGGKVALLRRLDDGHVLGTNPQGHLLAVGSVEIAGAERNLPPAGCLERGAGAVLRCDAPGERFIRGDPMKVATNVLSGWR